MGCGEGVVPVRDQHGVTVTHLPDEVARAVGAIQPLQPPRFGPAELVVVELFEPRLIGQRVDVVLVGWPAGPVAGRGERLDELQPLGREVGRDDLVDLSRGVPRAAHLDRHIVGRDRDRFAGHACLAHDRCDRRGDDGGGVTADRPPDDAAAAAGRQVDGPRQAVEDRTTAGQLDRLPPVDLDRHPAAGEDDDHRLARLQPERHPLGLRETPRREREIAPARALGSDRKRDAVLAGSESQTLGRLVVGRSGEGIGRSLHDEEGYEKRNDGRPAGPTVVVRCWRGGPRRTLAVLGGGGGGGGVGVQPVTQKVLCLVSAPCEPSAWTVTRMW